MLVATSPFHNLAGLLFRWLAEVGCVPLNLPGQDGNGIDRDEQHP